MDDKRTQTEGPRVFLYQAKLPPLVALLLVAPVLLVVLSFAAVLVLGGTVAAFCLPLLLRRRRPRSDADRGVITLERDQYSHVDRDAPTLPPR